MVSGVKGDDIRSVSRKVVSRERVMVTLKFVVLSQKKKENITRQSCNVDDYNNSD